ncbi:acyl-CoA dehydrogenase C-terminal domain-containing protein [Robertkochia flava]|uniref:acyl-CoA dehydrogenase C-terminal domain-containing protein n=1 Tax=Robertkochia flava TaxID=3447986 RepID=UPI0021D431FE|nr:acyl-CoA dehydrogenase C-terminal domain-containing protein [Robertkochia marina]
MELFSTCVIAWLWLETAVHAGVALEEGSGSHPEDFYRGKILTMKYYFKYELPGVASAAHILKSAETPTLQGDNNDLF